MTVRTLLFAMAVVGFVDASAWAQPRRGREGRGGGNGWLPSLAEGKARAKATGKPLMVAVRCVP